MWNSNLLDWVKKLHVSKPLAVLIAVGSLGVIALAAGDYYATTDDTVTVVNVYPEKLPVQAQLHDGEDLRNVEYYPDNVTPRRAVAYNKDGSESEYNYRPDGTLERAQTVLVDETGTRTLIRKAEFLADGVTYKHDIEYFADGTRVRKELVLADANTQHRKYYHDNGAVYEDQVIVLDRKGWKLSTESEYRADSSLVSTYQAFEYDSWERKFFDEKGALTMKQGVGRWGSEYTELTYLNGTVAVREVIQNSSGTKLITRRPDGTIAEERQWYGPLTKAMMVVTIFDQNGKKDFYQSYYSRDDGGYDLSTLTIYAPNGNNARTVYYEKDGKINETIYNPEDSKKWMRRLYRANHTLSEEIDMETGKGKVATRTFSEEDNIRFEIPERFVEFFPFTLPDQVIEYHPQYMGH